MSPAGGSQGGVRRVARLLVGLAATLAGATAMTAPAAPSAARPNFIVILADDLGYGDLGIQGSSTIATPRIDRLAREGARFTDMYTAAPFCSPSRAGLLTGRIPARAGLPYVMFPAEHHGLPEAEITLAEFLRAQGYATACIGKWHLGWDRPFRPLRQGFDVYLGTPYSNDSNEWPMGAPFIQVMGLQPFPLIEGDRVIEAPADQAQLTRRYTERAVSFIREHRDRPFFLYLPHTMPHVPQYASERFAGKSKGGLYGDTIEELDWSTGVIVDTLRELGIAERTLVVFTSDNGAAVRRAAAAAGKAKSDTKGRKQAGGGERFPGRSHGGSNGVLRGTKGTTFEGGIRVPFIAWWPGRIPAGREIRSPAWHLDLFPTLASLAGARLPSDRVYDGRDITALLTGKGSAPPDNSRTIFHYFGYQLQAVREGRWKLLVAVDRRPEPRPVSLWFDHQPKLFETQHRLLAQPELYDLEGDISEQHNVAAQHPDVVARLTKLAHDFDAKLQRDRRPMQFVPGPRPPEPQTVRTPEMDLSMWRLD